MKKTKIICTIGPASSSRKIIEELIDEGMNAIRLNFSHTKGSEVLETVKLIKKIRNEKNIPLAIILDTKGPEVRIYGYKEKLELSPKQRLIIKSYDKDDISLIVSATPNLFYTNLPNIGSLVNKNSKILLKDGFIEGFVNEIIDNQTIDVTIINGGIINPKAHLTIPNIIYPLEFLSKKDEEDIIFAVENEFEYIALSFVSSKENIIQVRDFIAKIEKEKNIESKIKLIAKIENKKAVENIEEIIEHSDGIMVARGDLGVEMEIEKVPIIQKRIVKLCYKEGKPVIVATQMLESMIDNPIPTRAEASDVANACYDLASAVMLSGETAIGKDPIRVVQTMTRIIDQVENSLDYVEILNQLTRLPKNIDVTTSIATRSVTIAYDIGAKVIAVITGSGYSARMISKVRPKLPILAYTFDFDVYNQLSLNWGIIPRYIENLNNLESMIKLIHKDIKSSGHANSKDYFILVSGLPLGKEGSTNSIRVERLD
ncbi:MAG: pyruvate kinase [Spirochaetota bacterium]